MKANVIFVSENNNIPTDFAIDEIAKHILNCDYTLNASPKYNQKKFFLESLRASEIDVIVLSYTEGDTSCMDYYDVEDFDAIIGFIKDNYFKGISTWELLMKYKNQCA